MRFRDVAHASNDAPIRHRRELQDPEIREFWRELARLITFFDLCSPSIFSCARNRQNFLGESAPGRTRTCDPRLRRPVLYPTELRAHRGCRC
jgi:hypothetical protein